MLEREDPFSLAARQLEIDRSRIQDPRIFERKVRRLAESAHGFLRGSAPLFYEILARRPDLAEGPDGAGWIAGDMHVENVGAYRTDDDTVVFDLNDFDDACEGPWRLDLLRLTTSLLLASAAFEAPGHKAIDFAHHAVSAYVGAAFDGADVVPEACEPIADLIEQCRTRRRDDFLEDTTEIASGVRVIKRNKRTFDAPPEDAAAAPGLLADYVHALGGGAPPHADRWRVADVAVRLAGNGSLGRKRLWVLVDDGAGHRFIELKQAGSPAPAALLGEPAQDPAERVVAGARALLARPALRLAAVPAKNGHAPFSGRRLRPEEDKLDLGREELGAAFPELVRILGGLLGRAHRRAVKTAPAARWTAEEQAGVVDRAIAMTALHHGAWLAYARLTRPLFGAAPDSAAP